MPEREPQPPPALPQPPEVGAEAALDPQPPGVGALQEVDEGPAAGAVTLGAGRRSATAEGGGAGQQPAVQVAAANCAVGVAPRIAGGGAAGLCASWAEGREQVGGQPPAALQGRPDEPQTVHSAMAQLPRPCAVVELFAPAGEDEQQPAVQVAALGCPVGVAPRAATGCATTGRPDEAVSPYEGAGEPVGG